MASGSKYQIDMCHGPLFSQVLVFAVPLMVTYIVQVLFSAIDLAVIGRFGSADSMAAVGSCTPLITFFLSFFFGLSAGANVVVANAIGARDGKKISRAVHTTMASALWSGGILAVIGILFARTALVWMETPAAVLPKGTLYLQLYFAGVPLVFFYNFGAAILRAGGDTRRPMYFLLVAGAAKVLINLLLVSVFKLDVAGVAAATVIANGISSVLVMNALRSAKGSGRLVLRKMRIHPETLREILRIGIPAGVQGSMFGLSNVVIQSAVNSFGPAAMAGNAAGLSLEGIVYVGGNAFYFAAISFVGQNYGAKKYKRLLRSFFCCLAFSCGITTVLGWGICLAGRPLLSIYNPDSEVIECGMVRLKYMLIPYMLNCTMDIFSAGLRGLGHSFKPMLATLTGVCLFRVAWVWWVLPLNRTMETLFISYPISWILVSVVNGLIFYFVLRGIFRQAARPASESPDRHLVLRP